MSQNDSIMVAAVAKKLKTYLDIQRREQAFDLSEPYKPLRYPQANLTVQYNNFLDDGKIIELSKEATIKYELKKMNALKNLSVHERRIRLSMERQMARHSVPHIVSPYAYPVVPLSETHGLLHKRKSKKPRVTPAGRVGRGQRIYRRAPPQKITSAERERIVNLTTKLLVATETIALPKNRKQSQETQVYEQNESFPGIPAVRRVQNLRPKSAYSDPGPARISVKNPSSSRILSAGRADRSKSSLNSNQSSTDKDDEYNIKRIDNKFIITKKQKSYPSSVVSGGSLHSSGRPKSGVRSHYSCHQSQLDSSEEDIYEHSSTDIGPYVTQRNTWLESGIERSVSDISTQTIQNRATQTRKSELPQDQTLEDHHLHPNSSIFDNSHSDNSTTSVEYRHHNFAYDDIKSDDMSTQTRNRDLEPKVVTYEIYVVTGDKLGAGTNSEVKLTLFGEYGDTGERPLTKSKLNQTPFQRHQMDVFHIDSMYLGKLSSVRVGHNGTTINDGWYLERVIIKEGERATRASNFLCSKWLSAKEGDGQIVRDLNLHQQIPVSDIPSINIKSLRKSTRKISSSEESQSSLSSSMSSQRQRSKTPNSPKKPSDLLRKSSSTAQKKTSKSREFFDKSEKRASPRSTVSSQKHRTSSRFSSETISSSSDSENELEKLEQEKRKRREKRYSSRENLTEKPKASLVGLINKVSQPIKSSGRNRTSSESSSVSSKTSSGRDTPNRKTISPSPLKQRHNGNNKIPNGKRSISPSVTKHTPTFSNIKKNASKDTAKSIDLKTPTSLTIPKNDVVESSFNLSSVSTSSNSSDSSDNEKEKINLKTENKIPKPSEDEDDAKVEFSNKNTTKRYSVDDKDDDKYMSGFMAGIKANQMKNSEEEKLAKQKAEFEEQLKKGHTIHQACESGDVERVKELIASVPELKEKPDEQGWSPIHISAAFGHLDLVKWFSVTGVSLTKETPTGYTAIHLAAMNGHVNCIMILAAMGCPISSRTVDQSTPLHLAAMSGHIECVKWLISNRAKLDVKDANGRTPLELAEDYQHEECIQLLKVMKKELSRKDSVMAMLRDPTALKRTSVDQSESNHHRGADSGVGEDQVEEEWVSDAEETSDVIGRGGDDRPIPTRKTSVQGGRKESVARKSSVGVRKPANTASINGSVSTRKLSKQEIRKQDELQEKRRMYEMQQSKLRQRKSSFLDSIRQDVDGDGYGNDEF